MNKAKSQTACAVSEAWVTVSGEWAVRVSRQQAAMAMLDSVGSNAMRH